MLTIRLGSLCSVLALLLATAVISACATSTNPEENQQVAALQVNEDGEYVFPEDDKKNEVVCRRVRTVGSHLPKRVCQTRAQMEADQLEALEALGPTRTISGSLPTPPPPPTPSH